MVNATIDKWQNLREEMKNSLPFKLGAVNKVVLKKMNFELINEGIPIMAEQLPILIVVYFQVNALTQRNISNVLQKDKAGIQRSVQKLHKDGFLKIESDIKDKRKNMISLTISGKFVCERMQTLAIAYNNKITKYFTEDERKTLIGFLDKLLKVIQK